MREDRVTHRAVRSAAALVALALAACTTEREGVGRCGVYSDTSGTARITSLGPAPEGEYQCDADPVEVLFDFQPDDPAKAGLAATGRSLTVGSGAHPPRAWVEASGLTVGSGHPAVRSDQPTGACSPVVFELTDLDYEAGANACFARPAVP